MGEPSDEQVLGLARVYGRAMGERERQILGAMELYDNGIGDRLQSAVWFLRAVQAADARYERKLKHAEEALERSDRSD